MPHDIKTLPQSPHQKKKNTIITSYYELLAMKYYYVASMIGYRRTYITIINIHICNNRLPTEVFCKKNK